LARGVASRRPRRLAIFRAVIVDDAVTTAFERTRGGAPISVDEIPVVAALGRSSEPVTAGRCAVQAILVAGHGAGRLAILAGLH
jgi:hypothetical protein